MDGKAQARPKVTPWWASRRGALHLLVPSLVLLGAAASLALAFTWVARPAVQGQIKSPQKNSSTKNEGPTEPHRARFSGQFGATLLAAPWMDVPDLEEAERLADITQCEACHEEIAAEWRDSAHANSSLNNPFYRRSVRSYRDARGREAATLCAGCHDPLMLVGGTFDARRVEDAPLATAGVSCLMCHATESASPDGNASLTISRPTLAYPRKSDPSSVARHRQEMRRDVLDEATFCGSCHRGTLSPDAGHPHVQSGIDDLSAYLDSPFSGNAGHRLDPVDTKTCQDCHMPQAQGHRSHRFAGAHTVLATSEAQRQAVVTMLEQAVTVQAPAAIQDGALLALHEVSLARPFELLMVLQNRGTGHRFPGGIGDTQDTYVEIDAVGTEEAERRPSMRLNAPTHRLASLVLDVDGQPVVGHEVEDFFAPVANRTIGSRREQLIRYRFPALETSLASRRLMLTVRVKHRAHTPDFHTLSCSGDSAGALLANGDDPCRRAVPVTEIAATDLCIGARCAEAPPTITQWIALAHGLLSDVQENGEWALFAIRRAEAQTTNAQAGEAQTKRQDEDARSNVLRGLTRLQLMAAKAEVHARMGRVDEVQRITRRMRAGQTNEATRRVADCIEGRALLRAYRFDEAESRLSSCVEGQVDYDHQRALILAGANANAPPARTALRIAAALRQWPRSGELYRLQAINPSPMWSPDTANAAYDAYDAYRPLTRASQMTYTCDTDLPGCSAWQLGVATYEVTVRK